MMRKLTIILLLFVLSPTVWAQDTISTSKTWSLPECIEYAIQNNIQIKQNQLQAKSQQYTTTQAQLGRLPTVNASLQHTLNSGLVTNPSTNTNELNSSWIGSYGLDGSLNLFNGFQQQNTIQKSRIDLQVAELNTKQSINDISLNVALSYLQVLQGQELLKNAQNQLLVTKNQLERTEKLFTAGTLAETSVIDLKAQAANDEVAVTNAKNQLQLAKLNLMQYMNLPAQDDFKVQEVNVEKVMNEDYSQSAQQIYEIAQQSQYNIKSFDLRIKSSEKSLMISRANLFPQFSLIAGIRSGYSSVSPVFTSNGNFILTPIGSLVGTLDNNPNETVSLFSVQPDGTVTNKPFTKQLNDNLRKYIGFNLSIPILNGWQTRTNISQSVINQEIAKNNAQNTRNQLRQTIEQAYNDMKSASTTYDARQRQVEALERAYKNAEIRFNLGAINSTDFNIAKINLDKARADMINAKYNYLFRMKILDFYQNKPLTF